MYKQNTKVNWTKGCILLFSKRIDHEITKNYRGITLFAIAGEVINTLLHSHIRSEVEKVLGKIRMVSREIYSQFLRFWLFIISSSIKINLKITFLLVDFSKAFDSIHGGKMKQIRQAYDLPKETVTNIMMLYENRSNGSPTQ